MNVDGGQYVSECMDIYGGGTIPSGKVLRLVVYNGKYWPQGKATKLNADTWKAFAKFGEDATPVGSEYQLMAVLVTQSQSDAMTGDPITSLPVRPSVTRTVYRNGTAGGC